MKKRSPGAWRNRLDKLFSEAVRSRGKCERCGKVNVKLDTSHIVGRSNKEVRWNLKNAFCLCSGCHFLWHANPLEAVEWTKEKMGEKGYQELRKAARKTRQWFEDYYIEIELTLLEEIKRTQ